MDMMERILSATHCYVGIKDGVCVAACLDLGAATADDVADMIRAGYDVQRVQKDIGKSALNKPWPA